MTNLAPQSADSPVTGAFFQPAPGVAVAGVEPYRDSQATVQAAAKASAPGAGAAVATLTTPAAGLYEISGTLSITGATAVATDSHNFALKAGATTLLTNIPIGMISTTGMEGAVPFGPVLVHLDGATSVTVNAVSAATASSVYAAQIIGRLVG